ncbi:MAG: A/G-specific adenine glycosylase [Thermoflexibacter sp.]
MNPNSFDFAERLIQWYEQNKRDLPWRDTNNPYFIWLSEVILQQTRVNQGLPYYLKFIETFPTIQDMADAKEQEVLRLWQGLGYYSRARNMHYSAKMVVEKWNGLFPTSYQEILQLKGVGNYTAAAIASFAFGEDVAVVDGNVFRVLARIFGIEEDIGSNKGQKIFNELANELLPKGKSAVYNQAIMEFGAVYCKPTSPDCPRCIFADKCLAFAQKKQETLPIKIKKIKTKYRNFNYLVFEFENKLMMKMRKEGDIWQGLYDFTLLEKNELNHAHFPLMTSIYEHLGEVGLLSMRSGQALDNQDEMLKAITIQRESKPYKHILTHQQISAKFIHLKLHSQEVAKVLREENNLQLYSLAEIHDLPKPILIVNYLKENF